MAKNKVTYDKEARKLVFDIFPNFDKANDVFAAAFAKELVGKGTGGTKSAVAAVASNFQRKIQKQNKSGTEKGRIYAPLSPDYFDKKKKSGRNNYFVNSGTLRGKVRSTTKGKVRNNSIEVKASVPRYGVYVREGTKKMPARDYFTIRDTQITQEFFKRINAMWREVFLRLGIKTKR